MNETQDDAPTGALSNEDLERLEDILDDLRSRDDEVPQWEFLDGALAALVCTRRPIAADEYMPMLIGVGDGGTSHFKDEAQATEFARLWNLRWEEVVTGLDAKVENLADDACYQPDMMDVRGAMLSLPEEDRADVPDSDIPSFGQVWALGFMFVVENWSEEWAAPRDKETADWLDQALQCIVTLSEDDAGTPTVNMHEENGPATVSEERMNDYAAAIWAVYDLRQLWKSLGPRVEPVKKDAQPGRNDPCWCGSGKKFKKCHGA